MTPVLRSKVWQDDQYSVASSKFTADTCDTDLRRDQEDELNDAETLQLMISMKLTQQAAFDTVDPVGEIERC